MPIEPIDQTASVKVPGQSAPSLGVATSASASVSGGTPNDTIKVFEETLRVDKRLVETGRAKIHVTVSEHDEAIETLLMHQDVVVNRVPIGTEITAMPPVRREGETIIVSIVEERAIVEKRMFLKEELHIHIDQTKRMETQVVSLRREHAEIDREGQVLPPNQEKTPL